MLYVFSGSQLSFSDGVSAGRINHRELKVAFIVRRKHVKRNSRGERNRFAQLLYAFRRKVVPHGRSYVIVIGGIYTLTVKRPYKYAAFPV